MSTLARALALAAMLAAMNLAGMTTVAQAHATDQATGQAARRPHTERRVTSQQQATGHATLRRLLAREHSSIPNIPNGAPAQLTSPMRPAEPSGQPGWLTPALSALSAVLALVAGVAVLVARRAHRSQRAGQTA